MVTVLLPWLPCCYHGYRANNSFPRAYSVAVADFTSMLIQEPYNSTARVYRGRAYAKMGKFTAALEDLSCAIHLDPGNYLPFYHRAVLLRKENPKRALQVFILVTYYNGYL